MAGQNISLTNYSTVNNSSVQYYCKYDEPDSDVEFYAKRTAHVVVAVVGISLNIFVIVLAKRFTVRKNLHYLIINMALSDALYLFSSILYFIQWLSNKKWSIFISNTFGRIACKTTAFLFQISCRVSLITLLVISIERFRATRRTMQRSRPYTTKQRVVVLGICWVIPMAFSVFSGFMREPRNGECWLSFGKNDDLRLVYLITTFIFSVFYVIVVFIVIFLSIVTIRRLSQPQAIQDHLSEQQRQARIRRSKLAVQMVLISVLLYVLCWLPNLVVVVYIHIDTVLPTIEKICIDWRSLYFIALFFLPFINSCFSPCIYIIFLADFREAAKKVLCPRQTLNQPPNRRRSLELQPMANPVRERNRRRRRNLDKGHEEL